MAIGIRILSDNLSGQTTNVTYFPDTGGTINLGSQVFPFNYISSYYYGNYDCYVPTYGYNYIVNVPGPTPSPTPTNTSTPTNTPGLSPSPTGTATQTPTNTATPTITPTNTSTPTPSVTIGLTPTATSSNTPTPTNTPSTTPTNTATPSNTPSNTATPTITPTVTTTSTTTPTNTPTNTQTPTNSLCKTYLLFGGTTNQTTFAGIDCDGFPYDFFLDVFDTLTYCAQSVIIVDGDGFATYLGGCPLPTPTATPTNTASNTPTPTNTSSNTPTPTSTPTVTPTNTQTPTTSVTPTPTNIVRTVLGGICHNESDPSGACDCSQTATLYVNGTNMSDSTLAWADQFGVNTGDPQGYYEQNGIIYLVEGNCGIGCGSGSTISVYSACPTVTPTNTQTPTQTPTNTQTPTQTQTPTNTETPTVTPTETTTQTPTVTPTNTETPTNTPSTTPTNTPTQTTTNTPTPTTTPTVGYYVYSFGYDAASSVTACSATPSNYYLSPSLNPLDVGDYIYTDTSLTSPAPNGYYSNSTGWYQVTGGSGQITNNDPNGCL